MSTTVIHVGWRLGGKRNRPRSWKRAQLRSLIAERDGWTCWLCERPIDPELAREASMAGTLDHVLPISAGGSNAITNLRLAHRRCNGRRGARLDLG